MVTSVHQYESIKHKNGEVATIILMRKLLLIFLRDTWKWLNQNLNVLIKSCVFLFPTTFITFVTCLGLIFIILTVYGYMSETKISNQVFISISNHGSLLTFFLNKFVKSYILKNVQALFSTLCFLIILMILLPISAKHKNIKV